MSESGYILLSLLNLCFMVDIAVKPLGHLPKQKYRSLYGSDHRGGGAAKD